MGKRLTSWRFLRVAMALVVAVSIGSGLLCAAGRSTAGAAAKPKVAAPAPRAVEVEIISPEQDAKLRGMAIVKVDYPNAAGYVIFRVDDQFAYATTPPFQMRWDTSSTVDGQHVVAADAYDGNGKYAGTASVGVIVANSIPTPANGVLLTVRFNENDMLTRIVTARGELGSLRADEALPQGFETLAGEFRGELTTSVMDLFYEGATTLIRSRLRLGQLTSGGLQRNIPEIGQSAMLQVSRNGLTLPVATASAKPRLGLAEISTALRDFPVNPGDTWSAPVAVVCDLYSRKAVYTQARHVFEGLRWYRGHECAVVTSTYRLPELPLYQSSSQQATTREVAALPGNSARVQLTQMMGGGMRGGMGGGRGSMGGGMRGGMGGGMGGRGRMGGGAGGAAGQRPGAASQLQRAQLVDLEGTRHTYITRQSGRVLRIEDTITGQVEFRTSSQVAQAAGSPYSLQLTQMMGGGMRGGMGGRMGGMRGGMDGRGGMSGRQGQTRSGATTRAGTQAGRTAATARTIPAKLDYGFRLTTELATD